MRFLGTVWRLLVGVKDALVLLAMLLFFGLLYAALSATPHEGSVREGALVLNLAGTIVEQPTAADPVAVLMGSSLTREYRLRDVVHALEEAATDDRVKAVALDLDIFTGGGQTTLTNVGDAIEAVRRAGKPVIAYATAYTDDSYQLAAHASEIWLNPMGGVLIAGPGGNNLYYAGLLNKLGITANVYRAGTYKAAVEPFTRSDMSPEAREAMEALAGSLWESWQQDVRQARPKAQLAPYVANPADRIAEANGDMARAALAAGLVDKIGYRQDFEARMAALVGENEAADSPLGYAHTQFDAWVATNPAGDPSGRIGVLTIAGNIVDGEAALGTAGAETIVQTLEKGLREKELEALVVRIDSPGGSATASERIRQALLKAKQDGLPVVVSMGSVAASGGYWIATAGDRILAEPSTITGSIGVFGILPSFEGTLDKLGIGADGVKTTPLSGEPDLLNGISPEAGRLIQMGVDSTYRRFLGLVSESRNMPVQRVDEIAQGRVWAGGTARQLGLVDQFGSLDEAVAEAAKLAKLDAEDVQPVFLDREQSLFEQFFSTVGSAEAEPAAARDIFSRIAMRPGQLLMQAVVDAEQIVAGSAIQTRCLECPTAGAPQPSDRPSPLAWLETLLR